MKYTRRGEAGDGLIGLILGLVVGIFFGASMLSELRGCQFRNDAVGAGVAKRTINQDTGKTGMVWLLPDGKEVPWKRFY